jgi:hypothetical protein
VHVVAGGTVRFVEEELSFPDAVAHISELAYSSVAFTDPTGPVQLV